MMRLAILEDEAPLAREITAVLEAAGHACHVYPLGRPMLTALSRETFDLLILDWNLPDMSGLDVLAHARERLDHMPPVLFVTSRSDEGDIVRALDAGADDYVVKPIRPRELLARVGALLRRGAPPVEAGTETFGVHRFDGKGQGVTVDGEAVALTQKEFELALLLFRNLDRPLSRAYVMEKVWGQGAGLMTRTLDAHISRIRTKLSLRPQHGYRLAPVYAYGYRLERLDPAVADTSDA